MKAVTILTLLGIMFPVAALRCHAEPDQKSPDAAAVRKMWSPFFKPIPKVAPPSKVAPELVDLGRHLFYERALSPDRTRSCNDCHDLSKFGTNGAAAVAAKAAGKLKRDVPSIYNLAGLKLLRWDGAHTVLRTQTAAALTSPMESAMPSQDSVVERLKILPDYRHRFQAAFGKDSSEITFERIVHALTTFQEGLVTRAPFDDFLLGDDKSISTEQMRGAVLFDEKNCMACHTGTTVGGQMIQKAGILVPWPNQSDLGLFEVSGNPAHKMGFRVPPLRNVAETAPYFHDHSARSLRRAIWDIAVREQGMHLDLAEITAIESFLKSLTGKLPATYIKPQNDRVMARGIQ
jgi:cytochrome c peroxidase